MSFYVVLCAVNTFSFADQIEDFRELVSEMIDEAVDERGCKDPHSKSLRFCDLHFHHFMASCSFSCKLD